MKWWSDILYFPSTFGVDLCSSHFDLFDLTRVWVKHKLYYCQIIFGKCRNLCWSVPKHFHALNCNYVYIPCSKSCMSKRTTIQHVAISFLYKNYVPKAWMFNLISVHMAWHDPCTCVWGIFCVIWCVCLLGQLYNCDDR